MHRIEPDDLRRSIIIQLTTMPSWQRRKAQLGDTLAIEDAVDRLMERLFDRWWVVAPEMVLGVMHHHPGRFGETEPLPCEPPLPPPPPPDRSR